MFYNIIEGRNLNIAGVYIQRKFYYVVYQPMYKKDFFYLGKSKYFPKLDKALGYYNKNN